LSSFHVDTGGGIIGPPQMFASGGGATLSYSDCDERLSPTKSSPSWEFSATDKKIFSDAINLRGVLCVL
jgi:hypothetical protein